MNIVIHEDARTAFDLLAENDKESVEMMARAYDIRFIDLVELLDLLMEIGRIEGYLKRIEEE